MSWKYETCLQFEMKKHYIKTRKISHEHMKYYEMNNNPANIVPLQHFPDVSNSLAELSE